MAIEIREARSAEFDDIGRLMVSAYASLEGFPGPDQQPGYYEMLASVGLLEREARHQAPRRRRRR